MKVHGLISHPAILVSSIYLPYAFLSGSVVSSGASRGVGAQNCGKTKPKGEISVGEKKSWIHPSCRPG